MKVESYIRRSLNLYYLDNKDIIEDFIANQLENVYDIVATGVELDKANDIVIKQLGDMEEFKKELKENTKEKKYTIHGIIYSIFGTLIVDQMIYFIFKAFNFNMNFAAIIMIGVCFWPLSMWLVYQNHKGN